MTQTSTIISRKKKGGDKPTIDRSEDNKDLEEEVAAIPA
jgi:hypothetical protein